MPDLFFTFFPFKCVAQVFNRYIAPFLPQKEEQVTKGIADDLYDLKGDGPGNPLKGTVRAISIIK
jgi:hypothetical protein